MIASCDIRSQTSYHTTDQRGSVNKSLSFVRLVVGASILSLTICIAMIQLSPIAVVTYKVNFDMEQSEDTIDDGPKYPKIAWLLSFPNSGTSFTMTQVKKITATTTASNYVKEIKGDLMRPVDPSRSLKGPFMTTDKLPRPDGYVLTKTHCGGYGTRHLEVLSSFDFLKECAHVKYDDKPKTSTYYDPRIVDKTIHLFRNPFDNIVSRFHLEQHKAMAKEKGEWVQKFPNSRDGFRKWCREYDNSLVERKTNRIIHSFLKDIALDGVLCYMEFYKYVHWHNNAFHVSEKLNIPSLIVHYEEYNHDYNATERNILEFLNLEKKIEGNQFHMSNYDEYFTWEEKKNITEFVYAIASSQTLDQLNSHYFSSY